MFMNRRNAAICALMIIIAVVAAQLNYVCRINGICIALADEEPSCIYLTFDDGPSDRVTPKILDILKDEDVKATFFIVGKCAERRKYLIERESREGHCVAVHSYSHSYADIYATEEALLADIDKCNDIIEEVTGARSKIYRFPGGSFNVSENLIASVIAHGMRYVDWNASTRDAEIYNPTAAQLYRAALDTPANKKRIVLLSHDTTDKTATAEALRDIIRYYKGKNYIFKRF